MARITTSIKVEEDLRDQARRAGLSLSELFEKALREALSGPTAIPTLSMFCVCGHGRTRHITVTGREGFVIYKCYECLRYCTTGQVERKEDLD